MSGCGVAVTSFRGVLSFFHRMFLTQRRNRDQNKWPSLTTTTGTLNVAPSSAAADIKRAYQLALKHHPDKNAAGNS